MTAFGSRSLERIDFRSGRRRVLADAGFPFTTTDPRPAILRVVL